MTDKAKRVLRYKDVEGKFITRREWLDLYAEDRVRLTPEIRRRDPAFRTKSGAFKPVKKTKRVVKIVKRKKDERFDRLGPVHTYFQFSILALIQGHLLITKD